MGTMQVTLYLSSELFRTVLQIIIILQMMKLWFIDGDSIIKITL